MRFFFLEIRCTGGVEDIKVHAIIVAVEVVGAHGEEEAEGGEQVSFNCIFMEIIGKIEI